MAYAASARPIAGAVATLGVSDRVTFLRKTYAHLGVSLIAYALVTAGMMKYMTDFSLSISGFRGGGMGAALLIFGVFIFGMMGIRRLAASETSRGLQYLGLALGIIAYSAISQSIIWYVLIKFGNPADFVGADGIHVAMSGKAALVIGEAAVVTLAIFAGLTLTVFITKKDFSFLRGALGIASFAILGLGIAAMIFGSVSMSLLYSALVIGLMAMYILWETSAIMTQVRPTQHVAAALMLFTTVITLFIHVLRILAEMNRR
jgi:FtsH-binding integral membrane protein